ncbi:MAG: hypothetical protein RLZZ293_5 [Pseudomonadota bacterium]|jgi:cytidylate kinase
MTQIITIDGPASSGKGTVARLIANELGFNYLESGAIYRSLGLWIDQNYPNMEINLEQVLELIQNMHLRFINNQVLLNQVDVTELLRQEKIGILASKYSAIPLVRQRLLQFQRDFACANGLVTDGRDMGTVVFPNANLKIFLTATSQKRAERRYKQLQLFDKSVTITAILDDIIARDQQDISRTVSPLSYDNSFKLLDNSDLTIEQTVAMILSWYQQCI